MQLWVSSQPSVHEEVVGLFPEVSEENVHFSGFLPQARHMHIRRIWDWVAHSYPKIVELVLVPQ